MSQPNVLLITTDQHRGDCIGADGNRYIQTPHLDQLAYTGVRFSGAFSECPVCVAARRTLLTGQHGYTHGVHTKSSDPFPEGTVFLAEAFRREGYQTQAVGKMHTHPQRFRCGFDHVLLNEEGRRIGDLEYDDYEMYLMERGLRQNLWAHGMPANSLHSRPASLPDEHISDMWTARECCRFLERRDTTAPFFLYCAFRNPHPPLTPAKTYWDMYQQLPVRSPVVGDWVGSNEPTWLSQIRCSTNCDLQSEEEQTQAIRAYYALISGIDNQIGMLIGDLRERGLLNNTIILFAADHGEMLFDHSLAGKGVFHQASTRVPFIVSAPPAMRDRLRPGEVRKHPVMLQDVMPTLLDMAGIGIPDDCDGTSVAPIWEDTGAEWRQHAFGCFQQKHYGLTDNRMNYMYWVEGGIEQLFNIEEDPDELHDLSTDPAYKEALANWRGLLIEELERHGDQNVSNGELAVRESPPFDEQECRQRSSFNTRGVHW
jgi:arylsulfatase A-like enzyme